ncbi:MAG: PEP-CTERM sorting domain-containing protein [Planctomycetota bacterium]|nr:MAG: PEP-CTERM sorting domain-containing protein [Planctomycetota bacterium]
MRVPRHTTYRASLTAATLIVLLAAASTARATTFQVTQLTNDFENDFGVQVSGSNLVWSRAQFSQFELDIALFDGNTLTTLTNDSSDDLFPVISGNNVAWRKGGGSGAEIYYYDGSSTTQLTNNGAFDGDPQVSGNNVVWRGDDGNDFEIFLYDGTSTTQLTNNSGSESPPDISGNNVVWSEANEIYLYDGNSTTQLTNNLLVDIGPQVSGNNVVWSGFDGNDFEIYLYDGTTTTQLTNNTVDDEDPQISGNNVVWRASDGNDLELFLYDGTSTTQITNNNYDDLDQKISGTNIVWEADDDGTSEFDIHFYDGSQIIEITDDANLDTDPAISGDVIGWNRRRDFATSEIAMATVIDAAANASFAAGSDVDVLSIDLGTFNYLASPGPTDLSFTNLVPAGLTSVEVARLDLLSIASSGDTGTLEINLQPTSADLAGGDFRDFEATIDTGVPGLFAATYELSFTDVLGTDQTLTLNLSGEVVLTDDPDIPDLVYNAATGEVVLDPDNSSIIGYSLQNLTNSFLPGNHTPILVGLTTATTAQIEEAALAPGSGSIGAVFPTELTQIDLFNLLSVNQVSRSLGAPLVPFDLIVLPAPVPEPSTYALAALGLAMLLTRARRLTGPRRLRKS